MARRDGDAERRVENCDASEGTGAGREPLRGGEWQTVDAEATRRGPARAALSEHKRAVVGSLSRDEGLLWLSTPGAVRWERWSVRGVAGNLGVANDFLIALAGSAVGSLVTAELTDVGSPVPGEVRARDRDAVSESRTWERGWRTG